jgi:hypothetical protein
MKSKYINKFTDKQEKGLVPPVPPVECWIDKNLMSGCEAPTLKQVGGGRVGKMYQ